jgi:hypothetical protein
LAQFHAADLWVAVVPDVSKVGPAMEKAGKEAKDKFGSGTKDMGKSILDDLQRVKDKTKEVFADAGKSIGDSFRNAGSKAAEELHKGLSDKTKENLSDLGKQLGPAIGEELGATIGESLRKMQFPSFDRISEAVTHIADAAAPAKESLKGMSDALDALGKGDAGGAIGGLQQALEKINPDAATFLERVKPLPDILGNIADEASKDDIDFNNLNTHIGEAGESLSKFDKNAPGLEGKLGRLGEKASIFAAAMNDLQTALSWIGDHAGKVGDILEKIFQKWPGQVGEWLTDQPGGSNTATPPGGGKPGTGSHGPYLGGEGTFQSGGPINGPGAIGRDSVFMLGAPGEHVWTAGEVRAAGGHAAVHGLRSMASAGMFKNLRGFQGGGAVPLTQNPDGTWTSPDPSWAHLIQRESGGRNIKQQIHDVNSGGNEGFGLFQITPRTWARYGGQGSVYDSTPQQQAVVAARIIQGNPSGGDWGAGMPGRETASGLLGGLGSAGWGPGGGGGGVGRWFGGGTGRSGFADYRGWYGSGPGGGGGFGGGGGGGGGGGQNIPLGTEHDPIYTTPTDGGAGGGAAGGPGAAQGQQLGGAIVTGMLQVLGLDASVFKGFAAHPVGSPLDWGATKLGTGLINWALGGAKGGQGGEGGGGGMLGGLGALISGAATPAGNAGGDTINHHYNVAAYNALTVNQTGQFNGGGMNDMRNAANSGAANRMDAIMAGISAGQAGL